ncbi:MAG: diguanylate cyclase [Spirochaetia bacterium]|nr:diguanylate cyclase [Spirochaetia bacterium]
MDIIALFKIAICISALASAALAGYVYHKKGKSLALKYLLYLLLANMVYAVAYFFEISAINVEQIKFFLYLEYIGIFFIPIFWIFIAWSYHPDNPSYNQSLFKKLRLLYLIPIIVNIVVWTNDWHHLIYNDIGLDYNLSISLIIVDRAPGFWVINGIIILLYIIGAIRMVFNLIKSEGTHRKQYLLLTMATIPPVLSYTLILGQFTPYGLDINPIAFALSGLLLFWGMDNLQLFNILPVAQKLVIEVMRDAMIILDTKGRLIECNLPAKMLLVDDTPHLFKVPLSTLNPHLAPLFSHTSDTYEIDIALPDSNEIRTYSIYRSSITDRRNRIRGNLYLLHDLTQIHSYVRELEHLASSDGLTNLLNHHRFMILVHEEARRLQEQGFGTFSLIMFDLDNFKAINDTYGHRCGDMVLQQMGELILQQVRPGDFSARYGGEEFIILLHDTPLEEATDFAEKLRLAIEETNFVSHDNELYITSSFGVSTFSPQDGISWEITLNHADTALYMAKDAGRNVVKSFDQNDRNK